MTGATEPTQGSKSRIRLGQTINGQVWSNTQITLAGVWTIIYDDGTVDMWDVVQSLSGASRAAVTWSTAQIAKKNGWVVDGVLTAITPPNFRGQTYATVQIVDGTTGSRLSGCIACGYLYIGHDVRFGEMDEPGPSGGNGFFADAFANDPAAGSEIPDVTVPAGAIWKLESWTVQLVQGITQTPLPALEIEFETSSPVAVIPITPTAIGASSTSQLTWGIGLVQTSFTAVIGDEFHTAPLPEIWLAGANSVTIATLTDGIGANTNYGVAHYTYEEWVVPN